MFFISKCAISISFSVTYVYTTELFPTNLRQGLMGICAACGYIGSMTAPQTPLLVSAKFSFVTGLVFKAANPLRNKIAKREC